MVMTVRKNLLQDTPLIQDSTVVAIKKVLIPKSCEGRIAAYDQEIKNSHRRARKFITTFSLQIFDLFQAFHKYKDAPSDLYLFIAQLWPWVPISYDEMSDLISLLRDCIGQITAEDHLLINLSGLGYLHLREELFKEELTSNCELARCVLMNEKQRCINIVEKYIASVIKKEFSFGKTKSERMWKFLGEYYADILPNSFKQPETSDTESSTFCRNRL
jgi:hypothetical protein